MLFESILVLFMKKRDKEKEKFTENESVPFTLIDIIYMLFSTIWILIFMALLFRIVYLAFSCSLSEGIYSLLFSSHYIIYKVGDLIKISCNV